MSSSSSFFNKPEAFWPQFDFFSCSSWTLEISLKKSKYLSEFSIFSILFRSVEVLFYYYVGSIFRFKQLVCKLCLKRSGKALWITMGDKFGGSIYYYLFTYLQLFLLFTSMFTCYKYFYLLQVCLQVYYKYVYLFTSIFC